MRPEGVSSIKGLYVYVSIVRVLIRYREGYTPKSSYYYIRSYCSDILVKVFPHI